MEQWEYEEAAAAANQSEFGFATFVPDFEDEEGHHHHHHHHHDGECGCGHHHDHDHECGCGHHHDHDCDCDDDCDCDCGDDCQCKIEKHWRDHGYTTFTFEFEGNQYFVRRWGKVSRIPILLLHGFMQSGDDWWTMAPALSQDHCVYAMDILGHGKSSKPAEAEAYSLANAAAAADALIQQVIKPVADENIEDGRMHRCHIVGYSMGGRIALEMVKRCPRHIMSVIMESASLGPETQEESDAHAARNAKWAEQLRNQGMEAFVNDWEQLGLFASQQMMMRKKKEAVRAERLSQDPQAMANVLLGMGQQNMDLRDETLEALMNAWMPIAYICGTKDDKYSEYAHIFTHEGFEAYTAMGGHNVHLENPEGVYDIMKKFYIVNEMRGM